MLGIVFVDEQLIIDYSQSVSSVFAETAARAIALDLPPASTALGQAIIDPLKSLAIAMGLLKYGRHSFTFAQRPLAFAFRPEMPLEMELDLPTHLRTPEHKATPQQPLQRRRNHELKVMVPNGSTMLSTTLTSVVIDALILSPHHSSEVGSPIVGRGPTLNSPAVSLDSAIDGSFP